MRRIQYPLGSPILRVGQILHVKSRRRGALVRLTATPGRDAHSRHTGISGDRLLHDHEIPPRIGAFAMIEGP